LQKGNGHLPEPPCSAMAGGMEKTIPERQNSRGKQGGLGKGQSQEVRFKSCSRRLGRHYYRAEFFCKNTCINRKAGTEAERRDCRGTSYYRETVGRERHAARRCQEP